MYQTMTVSDPNIKVDEINQIVKYMYNGVAFTRKIDEKETLGLLRSLTVSVNPDETYKLLIEYDEKCLKKDNFTKLLCKGKTVDNSPYGDIPMVVEFWEI